MCNAVFVKRRCGCFESFPGVLAAFVFAEINKGGIRLILDKGQDYSGLEAIPGLYA
jgi:hypothetical protein